MVKESYDSIYKKMFSSKAMVASLIRLFAPPDFAAQVDLGSLQLLAGDFCAETGEQRRSDLVWRVEAAKARCYVLVMLEFQSTNDNWMALRVLAYSTLLLQNLVKSGEIKTGELLPPLLPFVIYNGAAGWKSPRSMRELSREYLPEIEQFQPRQKYFLIDVGRIPDKMLMMDNLSALLFRLERANQIEEIARVLAALLPLVPEDQFLQRAFISLLSNFTFPKNGAVINAAGCSTIEEAHKMLVDGAPDWEQIYIDRGIAIGKDEGFKIGEAQGIARGELSALGAVIREAFAARFGETPEALSSKIRRIKDAVCLRKLALLVWQVESSADFCEQVNQVCNQALD